MKDPSVGDFLFWRGELAKIIGETSQRSVIIEMFENRRCPECKADLGKDQIHMIVSSPLFQENAEPIPTIKK